MLEVVKGARAADGENLFDPIRFEAEGLTTEAHIRKVSNIVRTHLGMDVGFVSEFVNGRRAFRRDRRRSLTGRGRRGRSA